MLFVHRYRGTAKAKADNDLVGAPQQQQRRVSPAAEMFYLL